MSLLRGLCSAVLEKKLSDSGNLHVNLANRIITVSRDLQLDIMRTLQ